MSVQKHGRLLTAKTVQRFEASALVERLVSGPLDPVRIAGRP
jgi:hypothetical protein